MNTNETTEPLVEAAFVGLQGMRGLRRSADMRPVMFGELVHYVHGTAQVDDARLCEQLSTNLSLRHQFMVLLEKSRIAIAPAQAQAASKELLSLRETRAFTLKFKPSNADSEQVYVLLTVHPESGLADGYSPILLATKGAEVGRLCFPLLTDQRAQLLLVEGDHRLALLREPDTEVSLV